MQLKVIVNFIMALKWLFPFVADLSMELLF